MTKRKKLIITTISLIILVALAALALSLSKKDNISKNSSDDINAPDNRQALNYSPNEPLKAPSEKPNNEDIYSKKACDLLNSQLASQTLGGEAKKTNNQTYLITAEYTSTRCEYVLGNKKAAVFVYMFSDSKAASNNKEKVQSEIIVSVDGGKKVKKQKIESRAEAKDRFVLVAAVSAGDKFLAEKTDNLLREAMAKL